MHTEFTTVIYVKFIILVATMYTTSYAITKYNYNANTYLSLDKVGIVHPNHRILQN